MKINNNKGEGGKTLFKICAFLNQAGKNRKNGNYFENLS